MANFDAQITDLVGGTVDQTACDQWMADGAKEIINVLPEKLKAKCSTVTPLNASATTMDLDGVGDILHVTRLSANSGGFQIPCREIPAMYGGLATDEDSLDYYGTASDPVFWVASNTSDAGTLFVKPDPESTQVAYVHHITYPTVDASGVSVIANFPDEAEYLVVLYAAIKQLHQYMNSKKSDLPSDIVVPVIETTSESLPTWSAPDDFTVPVKPAVPTFSAQSVSITGTAPTYSKPVFSAPSLPSIGALTMPTVPTAPTLSSQTLVTASGSAPSYSKPSLTTRVSFEDFWEDEEDKNPFGDNDPGTFSLSAVAPAIPSINTIAYTDASNSDASGTAVGAITVGSVNKADISGNVPSYTKPTMTARVAFSSYSTGLSEADPGILSIVAVTPATPTPPSFSTPSIGTTTVDSTTLNNLGVAPTYDKPTITSRAAFNDYWTLADFGDSDPGELTITAAPPAVPTLSSSSASVPSTPPTFTKPAVALDFAKVNTYIDTDEDTELSSAKLQQIGTQLSEYQANIQNEQIEFNKESTVYQAELQVAIQNAQIDNQEDARKLQKYQAEVATYTSDISKQLQEYQQRVSRYLAELNTVYQAWAKTESDSLQQYNADMQNNLNDFNKSNTEYQVRLQEAIQQTQLNAQKAQQDAQLGANEKQQEASLLLQKENQEYSQKLQKYQSQLSVYQADVNTQVQEYGQKLSQYQVELNTRYQAWAKAESDTLQEYNSNIQNELNEYNKENAKYQANIQAEIAKHNSDLQKAINQANIDAQKVRQEAAQTTDVDKFNKQQDQALDLENKAKGMEKLIQDNNSILQKYQAEVSTYQANIGKEVQEYSTKMSRYTTEMNTAYTAWAKTESDSLQQYSADIQNELNEFNKENTAYQGILQENIQQVQLQDANEARKLQKYQTELTSYQNEVNAKVQEWVNEEWNQNFQKYQTDYSNKLQEYSNNLQNELNEFNKENVEYQAKLQKDVQDAQLSDANESRKLQKYQAETATYGSELSANAQKFTNALEKNRAAFDTSMQKFQSDLQKVSTVNSTALQKFSSEINDFSARLQKQTTDYQWYQSQYQQLKIDYQQGLQQLIGGGVPQQQQE